MASVLARFLISTKYLRLSYVYTVKNLIQLRVLEGRSTTPGPAPV